MRKKWKIILKIVVAIVLFSTIAKWDEIVLKTQIRLNCLKDYCEEFSLYDVIINEEDKIINIIFEGDDDLSEKKLNIISILYDEVFGIIYEKEKYNDYEFALKFNKYSKQTNFCISNVTKDKSKIKVYGYYTEIFDIVKICPEASKLNMYILKYESLEVFNMFHNLKEVHCLYSPMSVEEQEYILSLFPECELDWKGKED